MSMVQRYQKRISGPLMDRIDIHLDVQRVPYHKLEAAGTGEPSTAIRARVAAARQIQGERFAPLNRAQWAPDVLVNGDIGSPLGAAEVQRFCELDETGKNLMRAAVQQMNPSARAYLLHFGRHRKSTLNVCMYRSNCVERIVHLSLPVSEHKQFTPFLDTPGTT
jgi:magnesium chelatase family protein